MLTACLHSTVVPDAEYYRGCINWTHWFDLGSAPSGGLHQRLAVLRRKVPFLPMLVRFPGQKKPQCVSLINLPILVCIAVFDVLRWDSYDYQMQRPDTILVYSWRFA